MADYLLAVLTEQADHIWYTENPDTVDWAEIKWVESLWNLWPDVYYSVYGYVSF